MDKSKVKSILPKPSPLSLPSPIMIKSESAGAPAANTNKRRSLTSAPVQNSDLKRKRAKSTVNPSIMSYMEGQDDESINKTTGHRPVTSCTFCRQHKIKCNASDNYPNPCARCEKMELKCEIDPKFRPKKGSQIQTLKNDVDELKAKIEMLTKNETLLTQALNQHNLNFLQQQQQHSNFSMSPQLQPTTTSATGGGAGSLSSYHNTPVQRPSNNLQSPRHIQLDNPTPTTSTSSQLPEAVHTTLVNTPGHLPAGSSSHHTTKRISHATQISQPLIHSEQHTSSLTYTVISEFVLGTVHLSLEKADELHERFITKHLPFFPIFESKSATELYHKSQLLFWSVMLTSALSEPEPTLYMSLALLIKQLAIETCWIHTPRSTHVIQALIILSLWPLPNEKILDDCSYRFIGLAKKLSLQLGLHRGGEFIQEFSRTQVSLGPDAEYWRTRSWLAVFFCEQFWSSVLGLPPSINTTDYLIENARVDTTLPSNFRCLISLSIFQCKLVNVMGVSVTSPDGLLEPLNRAGSLNILDRELERLRYKLPIDDGSSIEVYFLYVKLMICCFAFLPGTPIEDQVKYVSSAYMAATRIITITSQMINNNTVLLIELPIYVRQAITYSVLLLFKLQLSRYLIDKYVDSARQLIVTVHRLLRNTLSSWKDLQNDISRTARLLENLNIVLLSYPDIFTANTGSENNSGGSIISRMRSHLTASLFYDLVWCVHEARRRNLENKNNGGNKPAQNSNSSEETEQHFNYRKPVPLPFYNQITKDDFKTIITTTPNGTTVTTLVPTDEALNQARLNVNAKGLKEPLEINGIPLSMLDATGSMIDHNQNGKSGNQNFENANNNTGNNNNNNNSNNITDMSGSIMSNSRSFLDDKPQQITSQTAAQFPSFGTGALPLFIPDLGQQSPIPLQMQPPLQQQALPDFPGTGQTPLPLPYDVRSVPPTTGVTDQIATFLQQQSNGWLNNENYEDDDFLGWFDMNLEQKD